jgi:peptide/nickel transport system permease protein
MTDAIPPAEIGMSMTQDSMRPKANNERIVGLFKYMRRNPALLGGLILLFALLVFWGAGSLLWDTSKANPLSVPAGLPPSAQFPLGTDNQGRDLLATMIAGTPLTLRIGLVAGFLGAGIGTILAFIAGYYGGAVDTIIRTIVDIGLTVPSLLVLVVVAVSFKESLSVDQMGLVVASTAWLWPARTTRSQVITLRERTWVKIARLSGLRGLEIVVKEMMPNLIPYIAASLVSTISSAILACIGLEALGLGPMNSPTLGMTIYWAIFYSAIMFGMWWWWAPPIIIIAILFVGLFLVATGVDEIANPRVRRRT